MKEIIKKINNTNASYRSLGVGNAKNTDLFLDSEHYAFFDEGEEFIRVRLSKENLSQAILFIASVLPKKYDCSSQHMEVSYSSSFVFDNLALLDAEFMEDGKSVSSKVYKWKIRKGVHKKNGQVDDRFYLNNLSTDVRYKNCVGDIVLAKFTIRNYLVGGHSILHIRKNESKIYDVLVANAVNYEAESRDRGSEDIIQVLEVPPLQAIYYGAPGTGKSYKIKGLTKGETIRTTFHPDSDYSTFVGAYKPTMEEVLRTESSSPQVKEKRIVYSFVPQAFLKAYVQAWAKYPAPQYLVIEEINRGNCAQIFGDLFQLLDRNGAGFSEYPIVADTDICRYLRDEFSNGNFGPNKGQRDDIDTYYRGEYDSVVEDVQVGKLLLLPCNLHILATMNTSDQSLFPIDSAFKRRWTWEYIPIRNAGRGWVIRADGRAWDWWSFLERINEEIGNATESEDKKLGYYFVRPTDDRTIAAETFVGKVLFYLWNDVIKNYGFNGDVLQAGDKEKLMTFPMFYETEREGQQVNEALVAQFLSNLQVAQLPSADEHGEKGSSDEGMQEA